ncbi:general substrate transporter [Pseudomassariella vexata]|uniref:General substrate transporter n=1 Tax=Pseudomassariella vexata TaxID=1141098 RepID=A0A1Y2E9M5_9PEZI|nr:general substrate transporter [Pseudomassariella vexata]ORY68271.1 general substrate transporter [Pseudomassariella vexata]
MGKLPSASRFHPAKYTVSSFLASFGGLLLGIDTSIIGPVTVMDSFTGQFGHPSAAVHGIIVSSILLCAAAGSCFAGRPADALGRPRAMALGATLFTLGVALQAGAVNLVMFSLGRVVEGFGEGLYFSPQTVYICEIAPPRVRGALTTLPQFMTCAGLVVGYFLSYGTVNIPGSLSWRLPFIILAALSVAHVSASLLLLPESPRWLALRGRHAKAAKTWETLQVKPEDRGIEENAPTAADAGVVRELPEQEKSEAKHAGLRDLWAPDVRKQTFLAIFFMGSLQLCGIDAVLYYAPLLFQQAGLQSSQASFLASGVSAIVIVLASIPASLYADKWGRRTSTLIGGVILTGTMILMGALYAGGAVHPTYGAGRWVVIVCIYIYCVNFATTWAISVKVWAPEIQPQHTRSMGMSLAAGSNWICNWFVTFVCPILLDKSASAAYFLFGACAGVATIVCFFFMIETNGKSLDEIEQAVHKRKTAHSGRLGNFFSPCRRQEMKAG